MSAVVLMSTYNGARFIEAQIGSLLNQDYPSLHIEIRDDGSTDRTPKILQDMMRRDTRIRCAFGENIGVVASFFELLRSADGAHEFYAFCDQDDIWEEDKVSCAIAQMRTGCADVPIVYFSRVRYVDEELNHLGYSEPPGDLSFGHAVVENVATGCTIVINRCARELILGRLPEVALMHDWWTFLVVSAFGKVIYDPQPRILYRQHSSNVVGGSADRFKANLKKTVPFLESALQPGKLRTSDQVREFRRQFADRLTPSQKQHVDEFLDAKKSLAGRAKLVLSGRFRRQNRIDNLVFSTLVLLGFY